MRYTNITRSEYTIDSLCMRRGLAHLGGSAPASLHRGLARRPRPRRGTCESRRSLGSEGLLVLAARRTPSLALDGCVGGRGSGCWNTRAMSTDGWRGERLGIMLGLGDRGATDLSLPRRLPLRARRLWCRRRRLLLPRTTWSVVRGVRGRGREERWEGEMDPLFER